MQRELMEARAPAAEQAAGAPPAQMATLSLDDPHWGAHNTVHTRARPLPSPPRTRWRALCVNNMRRMPQNRADG